jgi:hypothetical protein
MEKFHRLGRQQVAMQPLLSAACLDLLKIQKAGSREKKTVRTRKDCGEATAG